MKELRPVGVRSAGQPWALEASKADAQAQRNSLVVTRRDCALHILQRRLLNRTAIERVGPGHQTTKCRGEYSAAVSWCRSWCYVPMSWDLSKQLFDDGLRTACTNTFDSLAHDRPR